MEKKLVEKMIKNCLKQYYEMESMPLGAKDLEKLTDQILQTIQEEPATDLFGVINDVVYEYLTGS
ncbi:YqzH family protein [Neobacillus sp. LXY-1]|uniref:YqzH family protein n=1 Tax=Neobacillus sp. LXY-1 TaxID=3379133 RepID=UPI003EE2F261